MSLRQCRDTIATVAQAEPSKTPPLSRTGRRWSAAVLHRGCVHGLPGVRGCFPVILETWAD
jgi:hypothetical protein